MWSESLEEIIKKCYEVSEMKWGKFWWGSDCYISAVKWNEGKVIMKGVCNNLWQQSLLFSA
jgi:hypothetical protein